MSDNIDRDEIRKAIDRLQLEHPVHFAFDATRIVEPSMAKTVQDDIDRVAEMMARDASIHIICEMAKLYLDGVKPTVEPKKSYAEWIPCSERLPEDIRPVIVTWKNTDPASYYQDIVGKHFIGTGHFCNGKWFWYSSTCEDFLAEYGKCDWDEMDEAIVVVAWMPLPEPYEREGDKNEI